MLPIAGRLEYLTCVSNDHITKSITNLFIPDQTQHVALPGVSSIFVVLVLIKGLWVEAVVSSLPSSEEFFSGPYSQSGFLLFSNINIFKFQLDLLSIECSVIHWLSCVFITIEIYYLKCINWLVCSLTPLR